MSVVVSTIYHVNVHIVTFHTRQFKTPTKKCNGMVSIFLPLLVIPIYTTLHLTTGTEILKFLIPRIEQNLNIPHTNEKRLKQILEKLKVTNSLGNDIVSMKTIKKLGPKISMVITLKASPSLLKYVKKMWVMDIFRKR